MAKVSIYIVNCNTKTNTHIQTHFLLLNPNMVMGVVLTFMNTESYSYTRLH